MSSSLRFDVTGCFHIHYYSSNYEFIVSTLVDWLKRAFNLAYIKPLRIDTFAIPSKKKEISSVSRSKSGCKKGGKIDRPPWSACFSFI